MSTTALLTVQQAAERLGTPTRFIRRLVAERRIRFYKIGRYVRFDPEDLETFIEHGRVDDQWSRAHGPGRLHEAASRRRPRVDAARSVDSWNTAVATAAVPSRYNQPRR